MTRNVKVSVIIPSYNRKESLGIAVNSALRQTYKPVEVIVVDDHSSFDINHYLLNRFEKECRTGVLKVYVNEVNYGAAKSRNIGADKSAGEYLAFLDSDDHWAKEKLERQVEKIKQNPNLDIVYCDNVLVRDNKKKQSNKIMINSDLYNALLHDWTAPNTSTLVFRKESFDRLNGFDETLSSCQDHDLWFRAAIQNYKVDFVCEGLSFFALDSSERISYDPKRRMSGVYKFLDKCTEYLPGTAYKEFRSRYICKAALPILRQMIKEKKFLLSLMFWSRYLLINRYFYKKMACLLKRNITAKLCLSIAL